MRRLQHLAAADQHRNHQTQALDRIERLQRLLLVGRVGGYLVCQQIGQGARILDAVEGLGHLRGDRGQERQDVAGEPPRLQGERLHLHALGR